MANFKRKIVALCLCVGAVTGCASVKVVRNPDAGDNGVRFYRPKPYLLVTPADPTGRLVNMKLEYLPDFNEEYSAHIQGKASVALKDGWNLVGVNTKEAPKDKEEPPAKIEDIKLPDAVVNATNVPIGYYESVYGFAGERKFLQGWRYIGMTVLGGNQPNICNVPGHTPNCPPGGPGGPAAGCISGPLYGLVFFNGVMTFRQLDEIANNQLCPMYVNPKPPELPVNGSGGPGPKIGEGTVPMQKPSIESMPGTTPLSQPATPPTNPAPPPGSVSISKPKATTVAVSPPASKVAAATPSARPAGSPALYVPLSKTTTTPGLAPTAGMITPPANKVATSGNTSTSSASSKASPNLNTPLTFPSSLDDDLFRTGTSSRP